VPGDFHPLLHGGDYSSCISSLRENSLRRTPIFAQCSLSGNDSNQIRVLSLGSEAWILWQFVACPCSFLNLRRKVGEHHESRVDFIDQLPVRFALGLHFLPFRIVLKSLPACRMRIPVE